MWCGYHRDVEVLQGAAQHRPGGVLNQCRMNHATRALRETLGICVTQIAMHLGFNFSQYFATLFRKRQ
jgi:AraC-like DNA-binding protein